MKTYKEARKDLLAQFAALGWAVKADLKIPHATSPDGSVRFWFKPQAVYYTVVGRGLRHDFGNARTLNYTHDIRAMTAQDIIVLAEVR